MLSGSMFYDELRLIGENCSHYRQRRYGSGAVMRIYEEEGISCSTCKNWSGSRCIIDAFDKVAADIGIVPEKN
ncbi:hypothetical protein [Thermoclostridium stercorarium]|nr:hypothetical protein Clst_2399 [Thermoclostridium stercorarium subsp. stercorarium DSM 8532]